MDFACLCTISDGIVSGELQTSQEKIQLNIEESLSYALLSDNELSSYILQAIAGLRSLIGGEIAYYGPLADKETSKMELIQYVPDDIICYPNMKVEDYLCGIALSTSVQEIKEAGRLCGMFHIDPQEELLDLTFEQNRMLGMIQALVRNPKLMLLDHPRDMLSRNAYLQLWRELLERQKNGMAIVVAESSYDQLLIPFDHYMFWNKGEEKNFSGKELSVPYKVLTLDGADMRVMDLEKTEVLYQEGDRVCFLYKETNAKEIAKRIYHSGCYNFQVEELSMEEYLFEEYERWML